MQSIVEPRQVVELLIETEEEMERVVVPHHEASRGLDAAHDLVNERLGEFVKLGRKIGRTSLDVRGAETILVAPAGRCALDGPPQERVERDAEKEAEPLDACERGERGAGADDRFAEDSMKMAVDAIERALGESLRMDDFLEVARWRVKLQTRLEFSGEFLREPRVKEIVAGAKGDGPGADHGDHFSLVDPDQEIVPKIIVECAQHALRGFGRVVWRIEKPPASRNRAPAFCLCSEATRPMLGCAAEIASGR